MGGVGASSWLKVEEASCFAPNVYLVYAVAAALSGYNTSPVLSGAAGMVYGKEWAGREARLLRHS